MKVFNQLKSLIWKDIWCRMSFFVLTSWCICALIPLLIPELADVPSELSHRLQPPSFQYWLGVDSNGSSLLLLLMNGARTSLIVSLATVLSCLLIGVPVGALAGYWGGIGDAILSRIMDVLLAFPPMILPLAITSFFGAGLTNVIIALSLTGWVSYARLVRGQFLSLRRAEFVLASEALGASPLRLMWRHMFPNALSPLAIQATFSLAGVIISEAGLSYLGLGVQDTLVSWGSLLSDARTYLTEAPHLAIIPSVALFSVVASLNFLGEALRIAFHPKSGFDQSIA